MASSTLNEESVERKLHAVNNTQDGIQSMSLWIIHHKAHHKKIVDLWLKVLKKGKTAHRLTLFYLCNDVVQNCKKKQAKIYMETFKGVLKDAAPFVRESAIKSNVGRIFTIWEERNVYDSNFISELKDILDPDTSNRHSTRSSHQMAASPKAPKLKPSKLSTPKASTPKPSTPKPATPKPSTPKSTPQQPPPQPQPQPQPTPQQAAEVDEKTKLNHQQIVADFKAQKMLEKISSVGKMESEGEIKLLQLSTLRLDASNLEAVKQLKDRAHGKEFSRQFEDACNKLDDYVLNLQKEIDHRTAMITMLEQSELFYEDQYKEAKIVANAYKNFGSRVAIVKKKLDELKLTLPDPPSPIPSPTPDAPSPGSTPPPDIEMQADNTEAVDMELSESDDDTDATRNILEVVNDTEANAEMSPQSITWPPSPSSDSNQMTDQKGLTEEDLYDPGAGVSGSKKAEECNSLEKRIASMLPNLPLGATISSPISEAPPPVLQQQQQQQQPSSRKEHRYHSERKHSRSSNTASDESPDWLDGSSGRSSSTSPAHSSHKSGHRKQHSSSSGGMHNSSSSSSSSSSRVASSSSTAAAAVVAVAAAVAAAATTAYDSPPLSNDEGSSTPLNDEGGGTPVQDEKEEQTTRENPIDFLTKLINQTQKSPKTSTASFLQNLMNTGMKQFTPYDDSKTKETPADLNPSSMPPQMPPPPLGPVPVSMPNQSPSPQHNQTTPPQSWAAWKAQHGPPDDIPNLITSAPPPPPPIMPPQILSPQPHEQVGMPPMPPMPDITTLPPLMGPPPPPDHLPGLAPMPPLPDSLPSGIGPVPPPDCLPPGMVNPGTESIPPPGMPPMQPPESVGMPNIQRHDQMVMSGRMPGLNPPFRPPDTSLPPRSPWKHDMNAPYCPISQASDPSDGYNSSPQGQTSPEPCPMPPPWMSQPPPQHDTSIPPPMTMGPPPPHARSMGRSVLQDYSTPSENMSPLSDSLQGVKPPPQAPAPPNGNTPLMYTGRVNRLLSQSEFHDDQREFTEKLKRKTTSNLVTPPIVDSLSGLTDVLGAVSNLTAITLEEEASRESNSASNTEEGESNLLADGGTAEDTEAENKDEEPKGAPILTVSGIASRRYEPERLRTISDHRGDSGRRTDPMVRRFEQPVTDHTQHRQTSDSYRDRRRPDREFFRSAAYPREAFSYTYQQDWQRYYAQTNPYMGPPTKRPYEPYNIYYPSKY